MIASNFVSKLSKFRVKIGFLEPIKTGFLSGHHKKPQGLLEGGLDWFISDTGGYTTLAVALSLLLSLTLAFSLVAGVWIQNRSADIQSVADSAALAGSNAVASYTTLATVLDASVLTLGLAGALTLGAGLVVSAIPGLSAQGATTIDTGLKIFSTRKEFASSVAQGLEKIEETLPLIVAARSAAVIQENSSESQSYVGCAIAYPAESKTDFSGYEAQLDTSEIEDVAKDIQATSDEVKELQDKRDSALQEGWMADCGNKVRYGSMCLYERAERLSNLSSSANPYVTSPDKWNFGTALLRARSYYAARYAQEAPTASGDEARGESAVRKLLYAYAKAEFAKGSYIEHADGTVEIDLPLLPKNANEVKSCAYFANHPWAYTVQNGQIVLHALSSCAGAKGLAISYMTIGAYEAASNTKECESCHFTPASMTNVLSASTNINNGFEYYWRQIYQAALTYQEASNKLAKANQRLKEQSEKAAGLYNSLVETLSAVRVKLCPPGAYGCVAGVWRSGELAAPEELITSFTTTAKVGSGAAISASVLAPDENTDANDVITRFTEAITLKLNGAEAGVLGGLGKLWSGLLQGYAGAYDSIDSTVDSVLGKIEGIPGGSVAAWLVSKIGDLVKTAGFEPVDTRLKKPVLTNSQNVLDQAGNTNASTARQFIELLGQSQNPKTFAKTLGRDLANKLEGTSFTLAELEIPGTGVSVPITVDLGELLGSVVS